jgi:glycosyltransferase involved in cell wall biosynthesis
MDCLVSVVVPIYNVESYLDRCIASITKQTYTNLEIILVDDGSPDKCPYICDDWANRDARIRVIHKINAGLGEARNSGLCIATGKYIFFIDSDDYLDPKAVERCVSTAETTGADSVIFGRMKAYSDGTIKKDAKDIRDAVYDSQAIKKDVIPSLFDYSLGFGVSACSKMFSIQVIRELGLLFDSERSVISEDALFCLSYFSGTSTVAAISDRLYYYFKNIESLTNTYKSDRQLKNNEFLDKCIEKTCELGLPEKVITHIKAKYHGMTLGALMQIIRSNLGKKERKAELRKVYKDAALSATLTKDIMSHDKVFPRLFWFCLKFKCYFLCDLLLICNKYR